MVMVLHADWLDALRITFVCLSAFALTFTTILVLFRSRGDYIPPVAERQRFPSYLFALGILLMFVGGAYEQWERIGDKTLSWRLPVYGSALVLISVALIIGASYDIRWAKKHGLSVIGIFDRLRRRKGEGNAD